MRQPPCAFTLDEGFERLTDNAGFLLQPGKGLRLGDEFIIKREGRAHSDLREEA